MNKGKIYEMEKHAIGAKKIKMCIFRNFWLDFQNSLFIQQKKKIASNY